MKDCLEKNPEVDVAVAPELSITGFNLSFLVENIENQERRNDIIFPLCEEIPKGPTTQMIID